MGGWFVTYNRVKTPQPFSDFFTSRCFCRPSNEPKKGLAVGKAHTGVRFPGNEALTIPTINLPFNEDRAWFAKTLDGAHRLLAASAICTAAESGHYLFIVLFDRIELEPAGNITKDAKSVVLGLSIRRNLKGVIQAGLRAKQPSD